jgi:enamine deaminase RidA (YjgF/YER057c/UK114 family)
VDLARREKPTKRKAATVKKSERPSAARATAKPRPAAAAGKPGKIAYGGGGPFPISMAIRAGDFVFTSALGDHGFDPDDVVYDGYGLVVGDGSNMPPRGVEEETRGVLRNILEALALAGCTLDDVVDSSVWLRDPRDFKAMNRAYREFFKRDCPTRSVFRIDFMFDCRVEIKVIAYKPLAAAAGASRPAAAAKAGSRAGRNRAKGRSRR